MINPNLCDILTQFIQRHDPNHIGSIFANMVELGALTLMLILVLGLYRRVRDLNKRMKEYHPDVHDDDSNDNG